MVSQSSRPNTGMTASPIVRVPACAATQSKKMFVLDETFRREARRFLYSIGDDRNSYTLQKNSLLRNKHALVQKSSTVPHHLHAHHHLIAPFMLLTPSSYHRASSSSYPLLSRPPKFTLFMITSLTTHHPRRISSHIIYHHALPSLYTHHAYPSIYHHLSLCSRPHSLIITNSTRPPRSSHIIMMHHPIYQNSSQLSKLIPFTKTHSITPNPSSIHNPISSAPHPYYKTHSKIHKSFA